MTLTRRTFLHRSSLLAASLPALGTVAGYAQSVAAPQANAKAVPRGTIETLLKEDRIALQFGAERLVLEGGLQPSMVISRGGAIVVQAQLPEKPFPSKRIAYHSALGTVVSRNGGNAWERIPLKPGENGLNLEGGGIQLRKGGIIALDTYVTPGAKAGQGLGQLYRSSDEWKTLEGPETITFDIPKINFNGSTDDGGTPHPAVRLHRRIVELPDGDLLTTLYGWFEGDTTPSGYMPTMKRMRVVLLRSKNGGKHWTMVSTIAADPNAGTEGFNEAVIERISQGSKKGRLVCLMRTGRELYEAISENEGKTWTKPKPRIFADIDVHRTSEWVDQFRGVLDKHGRPIVDNPNELIGAVVDPDLLELPNGVLVATFGVRVPPRACWPRAEHPWNGVYLACSLDQGDSWTHVVRILSGRLTTHYTAIERLPQANDLFMAYDLGDWSSNQGRSIHARPITITRQSA